MAAASTLAVPRASDPASTGSLTRMALAAPMASAVRRPARLAVGRHRHQRHLAAARLLRQLQAHLHAEGIGLVQDELARPARGCGCSDPAFAGAAGSGICLTQTTTFMPSLFSTRFRGRQPDRRQAVAHRLPGARCPLDLAGCYGPLVVTDCDEVRLVVPA